jgi:hypothetical protein
MILSINFWAVSSGAYLLLRLEKAKPVFGKAYEDMYKMVEG